MFRSTWRTAPGSGPSPHARGDVPARRGARRAGACFSPRPWGCSVSSFRFSVVVCLLPTPVGMFRRFSGAAGTADASPHARGDVPLACILRRARLRFSPRPWGCSDGLERIDGIDRLLPTPVGMFRRPRVGATVFRPSPHARGDVPAFALLGFLLLAFSPRPWGCSGENGLDVDHFPLLPTPVGMFRGLAIADQREVPSPHARGDVPNGPA